MVTIPETASCSATKTVMSSPRFTVILPARIIPHAVVILECYPTIKRYLGTATAGVMILFISRYTSVIVEHEMIETRRYVGKIAYLTFESVPHLRAERYLIIQSRFEEIIVFTTILPFK